MAGVTTREQALVLLGNIRKYHEMLSETDYMMPLWMPFASMILALASVVPLAVLTALYPDLSEVPEAVLGAVAILVVMLIAAMVVSIYVYYKLIARRNQHFKRARLLYTSVADLLEKMGSARALSIRSIIREMEVEEQEKSAVLWIALIVLIGIVVFYVYHFLNRDFNKHSARERRLLEEVKRGLEELGVVATFMPEELYVVPRRSTIVYIVLSLVTVGIFSLYWIYTLTKDPNEHFKSHRDIERLLISSLERAVEEKFPPGGER